MEHESHEKPEEYQPSCREGAQLLLKILRDFSQAKGAVLYQGTSLLNRGPVQIKALREFVIDEMGDARLLISYAKNHDVIEPRVADQMIDHARALEDAANKLKPDQIRNIAMTGSKYAGDELVEHIIRCECKD